MQSSFWFGTINLGWPIVLMDGSQVKISNKYSISLNMVFVLANNNVDPDEMPHNAAFHMDLYCLPRYSFRSYYYIKG